MIFGYWVVPITILLIKIFLSSTTGSGSLSNLKGGPYYILQPGSALFFLSNFNFFLIRKYAILPNRWKGCYFSIIELLSNTTEHYFLF